MEAWKAILIAFGGNAILIAFLTWLAKTLFFEWLKRTTTEQQIVFAKLHEKRAEAVANIYRGLNEYISTCRSFVMHAEHVDEIKRQELVTRLSEVTNKFRNVFLNNKLYLKKELGDQIERVFKNSQMPSYNYIFSLGLFVSANISENAYRKEWEKAFITFSEEVPRLLEKLEKEFRRLLGSDSFS